MPPNMLGNEAFTQQFKAMVGRGCPHCTHQCFKHLAPVQSTILDYRNRFSDLRKAAQDRDLLWMFHTSVHDHKHQAVSLDHSYMEHSDMEHTSRTATSPSSTAPAPPNADTPKAKRRRVPGACRAYIRIRRRTHIHIQRLGA